MKKSKVRDEWLSLEGSQRRPKASLLRYIHREREAFDGKLKLKASRWETRHGFRTAFLCPYFLAVIAAIPEP
jgi:hypothetical protein